MWTRTVLLLAFLAVVLPLALAAGHAPRDGVGAAGGAAVSRILIAVRLRIGGAGIAPLTVVWEEIVRALRLVALVMLLLWAVVAIWTVWRNPWLANDIPWFPPPADVPALSWGGWDLAWSVVGLLSVAAYVALVFGRWRAARLFAVLAFMPFVGFAVRDTLEGWPVLALWSDVLVAALLLLTLAVFHRDTPPVRPRPWLIALAVGVALTPAAELASLILPMGSQWLLAWPAVNCVLIVAAALVYLVSQAFGCGPAPSWALALALLSLATVIVQTVSLGEHAAVHMMSFAAITLGVVQAVGAFVVGLLLFAFAAHELRRLQAQAPPRVNTEP
jgi:hypothetical protein